MAVSDNPSKGGVNMNSMTLPIGKLVEKEIRTKCFAEAKIGTFLMLARCRFQNEPADREGQAQLSEAAA